MPYALDFTRWTEVDTAGKLTVTATTATKIASTADTYLYLSNYAGGLKGDFSFDFDLKMTATVANSGFFIFQAANVATHPYGLVSDPMYAHIGVSVYYTGGYRRLAFYEVTSGLVRTIFTGSTVALALDTQYYARVRRDESAGTYGTLYCDIYSDSARTTLVGTESMALNQKQNFTYIYTAGMDTQYADSSGIISNFTDNRGALVQSVTEGVTTLGANPTKSLLWYDGRHLRCSVRETNAYMQYLDLGAQTFGTRTNIAAVATDLAAAYNFAAGYEVDLVAYGSSGNNVIAVSLNKTIGTMGAYPFDTTNSYKALETELATCIAEDDHPWISGKNATGNLVVYRSDGPFFAYSYTLMLTITKGAATNITGQLVRYTNGDVGLLYALDGVLAYKHWTYATETWGDAEAITSSLLTYDNFRGVTTRNGALLVQYRLTGSGNLVFKRRPSSGAFGSETEISTTMASGGYYHISCADVGKDDVVYSFWYNATDIRYSVITAGSVAASVVIITAPALASSQLLAPAHESHRIPVAYHHSSGGVFAAWVDVTPSITYGAAGTATTDSTSSNNAGDPQKVTDYPISLVMDVSRAGVARCRLYNDSTEAWSGDWVDFTVAYWDNHDVMSAVVGRDGKMYFAEGGRDHGDVDVNTKIRVTAARLNTYTTAAQVLAALTDISPPAATCGLHRGYKWLIVDSSNVLHFVFVLDDETICAIERRSGAWGARQTLVTVSGADDILYAGTAVDGGEAVGQSSIRLTWSFINHDTEPQLDQGNLAVRDLSYAKLVPQGAGTYKAYRADGTEMTLPMGITKRDLVYTSYVYPSWQSAHVYAAGAVIDGGNGHAYFTSAGGTSAGSVPTWPTDHFASVVDNTATWIEWGVAGDKYVANALPPNGATVSPVTGNPCIVSGTRSKTPPCPLAEFVYYLWDGTNWTSLVLQNTAMPATNVDYAIAISPDLTTLFALHKESVNGIDELVVYKSTDDVHWTKEYVTANSPYPVHQAKLMPRTAATVNIVWNHRQHASYAASMFSFIFLVPPKPSYYRTIINRRRR